MTPAGPAASRALVVGQDADVSAALHLHLDRAGWALYCLPSPELLEPMLRGVAPHVIVLMLPASPDATWGGALTAASNAARVGVRVVVVAPSRDVVEPLAAVAGAERALARAEVLARPMAVVERAPGTGTAPTAFAPPAMGTPRAVPPPPPPPPPQPRTPPLADVAPPAGRPAPRPNIDLMALIDEVFISTMLPPATGTRLQVRLGLADGRKIEVEGEVIFIREKSAISGRQPAGCGVKLFNVPGWAVDAIDRFVLARPPIVYSP